MFMDTSLSTEYYKAEDSLLLPHNATLGVYNIENWDIQEVSTNGEPGVVARLVAELKIDGYEKWAFQWKAAEQDITDPILGGGSLEGWKRHVIESFTNALLTKKEEYLFKLKNGIQTATISTSDIYKSFEGK